ncbi:phage portal protein [Streptacidiphilus cavernicola]|uniref:Phage portal protein n=1 Tax=Streptacidiphilus cavernicola TaxID=3342716 RepID=A0ABV6VY13_9ACTN
MPDPRRLIKTYGTNVPASIAAGEAASQMGPSSPFSPGEPLGPYDGYSRTPRTENYVTNVNVATRPRTYERVSFDTLRGLVESYDVAQMCIWHRIDSIRSLDWSLVARSGFGGDVTDAIATGMKVLAKPDGQQPFSAWLGAFLYDTLAYDAGCLYRLRNRRGDAIGLRVVDGTTIAPLLDYWGNSPQSPAPAYMQYVNGLPWDQLTRDDLVYQPFRKRPNSLYGLAPLETILLNANTDLRFQAYFLQRFTEGNIPQAFASAPETWTPEQIEQFQEYWDAWILGDQAAKAQIKWMPGGGKIEWSNEKDFQDHFSLFLMRKTAAAFHVVPADLGFTESVNRSSGESQADVQHRVGDLPLLRHVQTILSAFLQDDLGLPVAFAFDLGEEQADRLQQAQADKIYIELGVVGSSEIRESRYGLPEPDGQPVPRFINTTHAGPVPLSSLYAVAGPVDPQSAAPEPGAPLPHSVFTDVQGVIASPPATAEPLAEQIYGLDAMPEAPPPQPVAQPPGAAVTKDGEGTATAGITTQTGLTSYDLVGQHGHEDDAQELAKAEMAAYRSFTKKRRRTGRWTDFEFRAVDPVRGRRLNQAGRLAIRKAAGEVSVAGLAVQAADTGRVLMLQRALDPEDPAAGYWEMPGGHIDDGELPLQGAWREFAEETRSLPPPGAQVGAWISADGIYQGFVWQVPSEAFVSLTDRDQVTNPDDPDSDQVEAIAWWDPEQLAGNPAVRPELLADLDQVLAAFGVEELEKAAAGKSEAPDQGAHQWPGWEADEDTAHHWAAVLAAALGGILTASAAQDLAARFLAEVAFDGNAGQGELTAAADDWLAGQSLDLATPVTDTLPGLYTDGYLVGLTSAQAAATGDRVQHNGWTPGDTDSAERTIVGQSAEDGLAPLLDQVPETAQGIADTRRRDLARELARGLIAGATAVALGRALRNSLSNVDRALAVAITEITRSSGLAALFGYGQRGVTQVRWVLDPSSTTCALCIANAGAGPIRLGAAFPSGDRTAPAHPNCRCAVLNA